MKFRTFIFWILLILATIVNSGCLGFNGEHHSNESAAKNELIEFSGKVTYVPDGDTIHIMVDGEKVKVRFFGIDCPEKTQTYGLEAKEFLMKHLDKNNVRVEVVDKDRYGRIVGKVYSRGVYLNELMVKSGYAWWYRTYAKIEKGLQMAEIAARKNRRGLWKQKNPVAPWDYRRRK